MRENKLKARDLGLRNVVEFPSGAALLIMEESKADEALKRIEEVGLQHKQAPNVHSQKSFRVHDIPQENTEEEVLEEVHAMLTVKPDTVTLISYKDTTKKDVRLAIIEGNEELIEAAKKKRSLFINYKRCRIDTSIRLMRCQSCKLLGHTKNNCEGIPEAVLLDFQQQQGKSCLDCLAYNKRMSMAGFPRNRFRCTDHDKDTNECPTRKALMRKIRSWPVRGPSAHENKADGVQT